MDCIYAGSFDPYTLGHHDIIKSACQIFGTVHILIARNVSKARNYDAELIKEAIEQTLLNDGIKNCAVVIYDDLVAKYCAEHNIQYLVRGLRNSTDFAYEENIANVNKLINPNLETVYLRAEHGAISSSAVRELLSYGVDISQFVPVSVLPILYRKNDNIS